MIGFRTSMEEENAGKFLMVFLEDYVDLSYRKNLFGNYKLDFKRSVEDLQDLIPFFKDGYAITFVISTEKADKIGLELAVFNDFIASAVEDVGTWIRFNSGNMSEEAPAVNAIASPLKDIKAIAEASKDANEKKTVKKEVGPPKFAYLEGLELQHV